MDIKIFFAFIFKISAIICDLDSAIDPIDTEFYQKVAENRIVQQEIVETREGRIVNGLPAVLGQFDYFVIVYTENKRYLCGGTLIKTNWVLSAGHCLHQMKNAEVHFGTVNRAMPPERILEIEDQSHIIVHENFDPKQLYNDIALIYLEKMSSLWLESTSIGFLELKPLIIDLTNQTATICGFGKTSDFSGSSSILNYINIPIMDYKKCEDYFYLDENNICVSTRSGESPCNGDSGGGAVITTEDNQKIVVGVVSFGASECSMKYPVVLTKVSNYHEWIENKFWYFENGTTTEPIAPTTTISSTESKTTTTAPSYAQNSFGGNFLILVIMTNVILLNVF